MFLTPRGPRFLLVVANCLIIKTCQQRQSYLMVTVNAYLFVVLQRLKFHVHMFCISKWSFEVMLIYFAVVNGHKGCPYVLCPSVLKFQSVIKGVLKFHACM